MIYRCFTEKKKGFDIEAKALLNELKDFVKVSGLDDLRILIRYDIEYISKSVYDCNLDITTITHSQLFLYQ